jgi:tetratricopeptide (TPR) repeat protein/transcriptional regulator with XRE-family HTH domain
MKKAAVATPNLHLKEARELRGWSQKYVAGQIGADRYYLSRWEHGIASPSPYYRQKLCALFDKNAQELGLVSQKLRQSSASVPDAPQPPQMADILPALVTASGPIHDPMLPSPLPTSAKPIGREEQLQRLRQRFCAGEGIVLASVNGLPGVGKTTLAVELAHDEAVQAHYRDGVLWAGLGPTPDVFAIMSHWGTLLGIPALQAAKLKRIEDWSRTLRAMIGQGRFLMIIDDAWRIEAALAFKIGGPHCAYLVTTRFPQIAQHFAGGEALVLHELSGVEGLALLTRLAPEVVTSEPANARTLVQAVGGLPLALTLMGRYLRTQMHGGQPRRIRTALERFLSADERLRLTESLPLLERPPGLASDTPLSLQTVIAVSDRQLDEPEQQALRALSLFPAKPNSFSEEAAIAVSAAPVEVLDTLSDAGLLESSGPGRYTLHQTIADYAQARRNDSSNYERMANYFAVYVEQHEKDFDELEQELPNIFAALEVAHSHKQDEGLVRCVNALFHFLFTRGLYAQEADVHVARAVSAARRLADAALLAEALLHQGKATYKQGNYAQAEVCLQEARAVAQEVADAKLLSEILMVLGVLARFRTSLDLAESYLEESLALAQQAHAPQLLSTVLANLGSVYSDRGRYADAETYNQQGLAIARANGDRGETVQFLINLSSIAILQGHYAQGESSGQAALTLARELGFLDAICVILTNMGGTALELKDYVKAEAYISEALEVARRIEDTKLVSVGLASLGNLAVLQGNFERATPYLQEALQIARRVGDMWLLSAVLLECGELYLHQNSISDASAVFQEALTVSALGNQEVVASALYGLARAAAAQGDAAEARRLGRESLDLFESMGNRMKDKVKAWLQAQ